MKRALVVIDVQSYFMAKSPPDLPARIADHIKKSDYEAVAFTVFKGEKNSNFERSLHWSSCQNEEDWKTPKELKSFTNKNNLFPKTTFSAFVNGKLDEYLKEREVKALEFCGIDLEACVLASAYDAFDHGYEVKVLFDLSHSRFGLTEPLKQIINRNLQSKN